MCVCVDESERVERGGKFKSLESKDFAGEC